MSELLGISRWRFHEGRRDQWLRLSEQAAQVVRDKDPGTLQYDIYLNADETEAMVIERFRDSESAMAHAANLGDLFGAVLDTVELIHGELLGDASPAWRAALAGSEAPALFTPYRKW